MYNELLKIGPITIYGYGLMTAIGIIAAYLSCEYRAKKKGLDHTKVFGLVVFCCLFGYIGSKLLYFLTILPEIKADPSIILRSLADGWVVMGGIIGGVIGALIYLRWQKLDVWRFMDTGFASVAVAQGFGRIGCFLAGCCYGKPTDSHFGVVFPVEAIAPSGIPLIPTQLISAAGDFLIFAILLLLSNFATDYLKVRKGEEELLDKDAVTKKLRFFQPLSMSGMYLILYGIGRFAIEFLRADPRRTALGLTSNQYVSIIFVIAGLALIYYGYQRAKKLVSNADAAEPEATAEEKNEKTGSKE